MDLKGLHELARHITSDEFGTEAERERHEERVAILRARATGLLKTAESRGYLITEIVVPASISLEGMPQGVSTTKRMFAVFFPADDTIQALIAQDNLENETNNVVEQIVVVGVHDITRYMDDGTAPKGVEAAQSLDILTGFHVIDSVTGEVEQSHPLSYLAVLERLNMSHPVFPSDESRLQTGGLEQQLYPEIQVTSEMEFAAGNRGQQGQGHIVEGMQCALDQVERALAT